MTRRALIGLSGLLCVLLLALYAMFMAARGTTPSIRDSEGRQVQGSIASLEEIVLGGARQWILLRGHDVEKPLMLFLHGGPGMPAMYLAHDFQRKLERDFVVVHWDRRGAGKSYSAGADPATLTVRRTLGETLELTDKLRARFEKQRIVLVGHSWGSYLAMLAIRERPDAYSGYVGIGQMAADQERVAAHRIEAIRPLAEAAGDEDLLARLDSGGVTEADLLQHGVELRGATTFWPILRTGLMAPEYDLFDAMNVGRGASRVARLMRDDILTGPPRSAGSRGFRARLLLPRTPRSEHALRPGGRVPQSPTGASQGIGLVRGVLPLPVLDRVGSVSTRDGTGRARRGGLLAKQVLALSCGSKHQDRARSSRRTDTLMTARSISAAVGPGEATGLAEC